MLNEQKLSTALLEALRSVIADRLGLHFSLERQPELEQSLTLMASAFGFQDVVGCAEWLIHARLTTEQIEILASYLTIGETYFFRERNVFFRLGLSILPALLEERRNRDRQLRIWSAACSSGEEAYSIAMMLDSLLPDREKWEITILATDVNPAVLEKARRGIYREWSFRQTPDWFKERYFIPMGRGNYEIRAPLRDQISFAQMNLAEDIYPSFWNNTHEMDLIFCRNVIMYFTPECARHTVERLNRCLKDHGWLIVGQAELSQALFSDFNTVSFDDSVVYQSGNPSSAPVDTATDGQAPEFENASQVIDPPPVEKRLLQILARKPQERRALSLLCRRLVKQNRLAEARRLCEQAITLNQLDPMLHYLLAVIIEQQGATAEAMAALRRALFLDPGFVMAHFALGRLAKQDHRRGEAAKHFANVRRLIEARSFKERIAGGDGLTVGGLMKVINQKQFENAEVI